MLLESAARFSVPESGPACERSSPLKTMELLKLKLLEQPKSFSVMVKVPEQVGMPVHVKVMRKNSPLGFAAIDPETCTAGACAPAVAIHVIANAAMQRSTQRPIFPTSISPNEPRPPDIAPGAPPAYA